MTTVMKPPLIVVHSSGKVYFFASVERAIGDMHNISERKAVEYVAYDSEGRLLRIDIAKKTHYLVGRFLPYTMRYVHFQPTETEPSHADDLRHRIVHYLARMGEPEEWLSKATLHELVMKGVEDYHA